MSKKILDEAVSGWRVTDDALDRTLRKAERQRKRKRLTATIFGLLLSSGLIAVMGIFAFRLDGGQETPSRRAMKMPEGAISVDLPGTPVAIVAREDGIWVLAAQDDQNASVSRISPHTLSVEAMRDLRCLCTDLVVDEESVWVVDLGESLILRLDAASLNTERSVTLPSIKEVAPGDDRFAPSNMVAHAGSLWVSSARGLIARLDAASGSVEYIVDLGSASPGDMVWAGNAIWTVDSSHGEAVQIDEASGEVIRRTDVGISPGSIVLVNGRIWVMSDGDHGGKLTELNSDGDPMGGLTVGKTPGPLAGDEMSLWVGDTTGALFRVDTGDRTVSAAGWHAPDSIISIAAWDGTAWVGDGSSQLTRVSIE
jgi:hypothetical protein